MVFVTQDVGQNGKLLAFLDQTHSDTGNRCFHRYTGIHQGQRGTADRSHGAGTVGLGDFRDDTDGVRELAVAWQHRLHAATRQTTVADFTTASAAHATTLTDRERWEVVVQHEGVFLFAFQGVQQLCVTGSTEGGNDQRLGFATGEQCRAVGFGQNTDFDVQRAHGAGVTAVDARLAVHDVLAHGAVFQLAEDFLDLASGRAGFFVAQAGNGFIAQLAQAGVAVRFLGDGVGLRHLLAELGTYQVHQLGVGGSGLPVPRWLAGFGSQFLDGLDDGLELIVGEQHGAQHLVFGELFGFRFNHQHGGFGTGDNHVQARSRQLLVRWVQQVAGAFVEGNACRANRAFEWNAGDGQGRRGTDHRGDIGVGLLAGGNHGADDLHFVHEPFREQRTDRTVDQARGQGFFLGRTAFTLEETTGDLAGSVGFFLVVNRQREEALAWISLLGTDHGHQHGDVVVDGDQHGAGCLTGNAARFESNGRLTELECLDYRVHGFLPSSVALGGTVFLRMLGQCRESALSTVQIQLEAGSLEPNEKTARVTRLPASKSCVACPTTRL